MELDQAIHYLSLALEMPEGIRKQTYINRALVRLKSMQLQRKELIELEYDDTRRGNN